MASGIPTRLTRVVLAELLGMALCAKPSRERVQHLGFAGTMRFMTLHTPGSGMPCDRVVLENEGSSHFGMASYTCFLLERLVNLLVLGWVRIVAIATLHASLRNRVMGAQLEFRQLRSVARTAQSSFI